MSFDEEWRAIAKSRRIDYKKKNSSENLDNFSQKFSKIRLNAYYFQTSTSRVQFSKNSQNSEFSKRNVTFQKIRKDIIKLSDIEVEQGLKCNMSGRSMKRIALQLPIQFSFPRILRPVFVYATVGVAT